MSIEQTLERIAIALENQRELISNPMRELTTRELLTGRPVDPTATNTVTPVHADVKVKKATKKETPPPAAPTVDTLDSMFATNTDILVETTVEQPVFTYEQLVEKLTLHAKKYGNTTTITLMKKYGADPVAPKMKSIPEVNYNKIIAEIDADLAKKAA